MNYIGNALSLGMFDCLTHPVVLHIKEIDLPAACEWVSRNNPTSCVGHADTASLTSTLLGSLIEMCRVNTVLSPGDHLLVAQYNGTRLPEGAKSLPEGAKLRWILVTVKKAA